MYTLFGIIADYSDITEKFNTNQITKEEYINLLELRSKELSSQKAKSIKEMLKEVPL